jgi:hypothetical protein
VNIPSDEISLGKQGQNKIVIFSVWHKLWSGYVMCEMISLESFYFLELKNKNIQLSLSGN